MQRAFAAVLIVAMSAGEAAAGAPEIVGIGRVTSEAERMTGIPVAVPLELPLLDESTMLYATLTSEVATEYEINLGFVAGCGGGNSCSYGNLAGKRANPEKMLGTANFHYDLAAAKAVDLTNSMKGYFIESTCGAHCDDAKIFWSQNGYLYMIGLKAGSEEEVIRMARSAIDNVVEPNKSLERSRER